MQWRLLFMILAAILVIVLGCYLGFITILELGFHGLSHIPSIIIPGIGTVIVVFAGFRLLKWAKVLSRQQSAYRSSR